MSATTAALTPYLNFSGNAAEAMKFYQSVLGGDLRMQTFGEVNMAQTPQEKDLIVHAALKSGDILLYASDGHPSMKINFGNSVQLSLMGSENEWLTKVFNKLSEGGQVDMPLAKQFWGDTFGMLTDKFGLHWMVNITARSQG